MGPNLREVKDGEERVRMLFPPPDVDRSRPPDRDRGRATPFDFSDAANPVVAFLLILEPPPLDALAAMEAATVDTIPPGVLAPESVLEDAPPGVGVGEAEVVAPSLPSM